MKAIGTHSVQPKSSKPRVPFFANSQKQGFFNKKKKNGFFSEVQTKLQVGKPGDKYEVEADAMADKVVQRLQQKEITTPPFFKPGKPEVVLQPQTSEEEIQQKEEISEEREVKEKVALKPEVSIVGGEPLFSGISDNAVQPKTHNAPGNQQVNSAGPINLVQPLAKPKPILQQKSDNDLLQWKNEDPEEDLQLKCSDCEKEIQGKIAIQAKGNTSRSSSSFEQQLNKTKGGGATLESNTRQKMESAFNADFSNVKVHTDSQATGMSKSINAQAFTQGNDIYFNEGKYNPASISGQHLLAHELTHTVQQGAAVMRSPETFSLAPPMVQGLGVVDLIPHWIINNAREIPGYTLFTVIVEYDPLLEQEVERTPIRLIEGLMGLVPFGTAIFDKLQEYGIIERVFEWVSGQLNSLNLTTQGMLNLIEEAWDEMEFPYTDAIDIITSKIQRLLNRIKNFAISLVDQLITWIKEALVSVAEPILEENRAWSLIKKIIHYDPLRDETVEASTLEILEDFLLLIDKETELEQMRERGTLQETADWLDTQIGTFNSLLEELRQLITSAWDAIQPENLPEIADNIQVLAGQVSGFLQRVWDFASTVAIRVLELIKDALLGWLNSFAADISGFSLITVVLGRNPLTDEEVPRTVENIIRGFMGLVPGGEAKFQELKESGVIPRAAGQIEAIVAELGFTWPGIKQLFTDLWNSFSIEDLVDPLAAFERITAQFGETISRLFTFVVKVVKVLVELVLDIMGIPPDMIANIIANAMQAFEDIKKDPIGFLLNLMNAVKEGFLGFLNDIGTHLMSGFQNWLFGTLTEAGVQIPADLSLRSILGMAMELLGITVDNILERLALKIGEERMAQIRSVIDSLTGIWAFVKDVIERGPIAIWEYIQDQISNLWNVIKEGIMGFIQEKVIQQAIGWLMSFLDVTGIMPVIRGVQTVFNAITSFIEKLREILGIVNSFVAGVADIAKGSIQTAAVFLETALADGIPVAISFLAKQLGLGDISEKIQEMIENARGMINEGIDWLIDKALEAGTAFLSMLGLGGEQEREEEGVEETAESRQIKIDAKERISSRLGEESSIEDARSVVNEVFEELHPRGLQLLRIIPIPNEENQFKIEAAASPLRYLFKLIPKHFSNKRVNLAARITLNEEPTEAELGVREGSEDFSTFERFGGTESRGGGVFKPRPSSNEVNLVTWNTNTVHKHREGNRFHAEYQFKGWLDQRGENFKQRINSINLLLSSVSPCDEDCRLLGNLSTKIREYNPHATFSIAWSAIYNAGGGPHEHTSIRGIADLVRGHWKIAGPLPDNLTQENIENARNLLISEPS